MKAFTHSAARNPFFSALALAFLLMLWDPSATLAQQGYSCYLIRSIPQTIQSNPAFIPPYKFYIGMPGLSGLQFRAESTGLAYRDIVKKRSDDSLYVDIDGLLDHLDNKNYLSFDLGEEVLDFGFRIRHHFFSFSYSEKFSSRMSYSKDFASFLLKGNGPFIGKTLSVGGLGADLTWYHEYALGWAYELPEKWTIGLRIKYLSGVFNVFTEKTDLNLYTNPLDYALTLTSDVNIHTSIPGNSGIADDSLDIRFDGDEFGKKVFSSGNNGLAFDLGVQYRMDEKFSFAASITDLGSIFWRNEVKNLVSKNSNASFTFSGLDLDEFASGDSVNFDNKVDELLDSLDDKLGLKANTDPYRTRLSAKIYLAAMYDLNPHNQLAFTARNDFFQKSLHPVLTLLYDHRFGRVLDLFASYSFKPDQFFSLGLGFSLKAGPVQFYTLTDNIIPVFTPDNGRFFSFHLGMNFVFGRPKARWGDQPEKGPVPNPLRNEIGEPPVK